MPAIRRLRHKPLLYPLLALAGLALVLAGPALAAKGGGKGKPKPSPGGGHHGVTTYNGSATCNQCHSSKAQEVINSEHFQWAGKRGKINDFCTYPDTNWLFEFPENSDKAAGCATCHVGFGDIQVPAPVTTAAPPPALQGDVNRIDCLVCHSDTYKRVAVMVGEQPRIQPDPTLDMAAVLANIKKTPSKAACLSCHARAGGGNGIKQGDMELGLANPAFELDVHMSASGGNLTCVSCHTTANHKIAGKGNDLRVADGSGMKTCATCHSSGHPAVAGMKSSGEGSLSAHLNRADCTACHIPSYARGVPTEMRRDFAHLGFDAASGRIEAERTLGSNLLPKYLRFDGTSYFYPLGTSLSKTVTEFNPATNRNETMFLLAGPGSVAGLSSGGKYHPFKVHTANMAVTASNQLIPLDSLELWGNATIAPAFGTFPQDGFENTARYLALYHQVAPKKQAYNACNNCHHQTD